MRVCKPKSIVFALFFIFTSCNAGLSQPTIGQIEKTQQDLEMEKALRTEVEEGKKTHIKKIIVKGITLLTEDQIKEITLPFKNHWLTQTDINLILDSIVNAYKKKGYESQPSKISFQIKKGLLEIKVEELRY